MERRSAMHIGSWSVFDRLPHPVCAIDQSGRVRVANRAWRSALDAGEHPWAICHEGQSYLEASDSFASAPAAAAAVRGIRDVLVGERPTASFDVRTSHRGHERWMEVSASAFDLGSERGALVQHFDVTEERQAGRFHRLAVTVGHRCAAAGSHDDHASAVVPTVCAVLGWPLALEWRGRSDGPLKLERAWSAGHPIRLHPHADREFAARIAQKARLEKRGSFETEIADEERQSVARWVDDSSSGGSALSVYRDGSAGSISVVVFYLPGPERPDAPTLDLVATVVGAPEAEEEETPTRVRPRSGTFAALPDAVSTAAQSEATVLLLGENGTGKTRAARRLHDLSARASGPFLDLNCAGLGPSLLESELFGHEKGAFTGATANKKGLLELAAGGTVLLDEIGELDPIVQAKLLKVLETRRFRRVGGTAEHTVDVRFVAATNLDLRREVAAGRFRQDLYYRLAVVEIRLPSLRERPGELSLIAEQLVRDIAGDETPRRLTAGAVHAMLRYPWPGNVRELRNVLERAMLGPGREITTEDIRRALPESARIGTPSAPLVPLLEHERRHIETVLNETNFNMRRAAAVLGIARSTLYARVQKHGIPLREEPKRPRRQSESNP